MGAAFEARHRDTAAHIARIRARGRKVVVLRLPVTGPLAEREEQLAPRAAAWDRLVRENRVPAMSGTPALRGGAKVALDTGWEVAL